MSPQSSALGRRPRLGAEWRSRCSTRSALRPGTISQHGPNKTTYQEGTQRNMNRSTGTRTASNSTVQLLVTRRCWEMYVGGKAMCAGARRRTKATRSSIWPQSPPGLSGQTPCRTKASNANQQRKPATQGSNVSKESKSTQSLVDAHAEAAHRPAEKRMKQDLINTARCTFERLPKARSKCAQHFADHCE